MSIKIVTWNVNSLKARADFVAQYLDRAQPEVIVLQELKMTTDAVPRELFESRGYHLAIHGQPRWNGVLIASQAPLEDVSCGLPDADEGQARLVAARTYGVELVNLYCPQGQAADSPKFAYKLRFYDALRDWLAARYQPSSPLVVLGDLNIAPAARDIWDPEGFSNVPSFHPLEHEQWAKLLALGLHDACEAHMPANTYSFWDYRGGSFYKNKGMRIDHILVTESLLPRIKHAWVDRNDRKKKGELKPSDHAPVGVELED